MDFQAGREEHPNPAPRKREMEHLGGHSQLELHKCSWERCEMPGASCALQGKGEWSSRARPRALLVPSPKLLLEKQNNTRAAAWLDQNPVPQRGLRVILHPRQDRHCCCCCFWDAPTPHPCLPKEHRVFAMSVPSTRGAVLSNSYFSSRITDFMVQIS